MNDAIELDRLRAGLILVTAAKAEQLAANGAQLFVFRRPRWGDMWFVKEGEL